MKKIIIMLLSFGLLSQQAYAVTVLGEDFAGSADSVVFGGDPTTSEFFQNNSNDFNNTPANTLLVEQAITDDSAATAVLGRFTGATLDLGFSQAVLNGTGNDLKFFFVGNGGQTGSVIIEGISNPFNLTAGGAINTSTGLPDPLPEGFTDSFAGPTWPNDPIVALTIDLSDSAWSSLSGNPISEISFVLGNGDDKSNSAVLSFAGAYSVVPVPAAVWLFGSGLIGLVGVARRKK